MLRTVLLVAVLGVAAWATAVESPLAGAWVGKITIVSKPGSSADDLKMDQSMQALMDKIKVDLQVNGDGTFRLEALKPGTEKPEVIDGTWTLKGRELTMVNVRENGKPSTTRIPLVFTVASNSKSFVQKIKPGEDAAKITFTRKPG